MKHFDKLEMIKLCRKVLNILPDGSKGPEEMFISGASHMHQLLKYENQELREDIERLLKRVEELEVENKMSALLNKSNVSHYQEWTNTLLVKAQTDMTEKFSAREQELLQKIAELEVETEQLQKWLEDT